jgi:hypothetical protein
MCWGQKNDSMNDRGKSPLEEKIIGAIPLVPLFTVSLWKLSMDFWTKTDPDVIFHHQKYSECASLCSKSQCIPLKNKIMKKRGCVHAHGRQPWWLHGVFDKGMNTHWKKMERFRWWSRFQWSRMGHAVESSRGNNIFHGLWHYGDMWQSEWSSRDGLWRPAYPVAGQ